MERSTGQNRHPGTRHLSDVTHDPVVMAFWNRVDTELHRRARRVAGQHAEDVRQRVAVQFFSDPYRIMATYTPERFANVALGCRAADHRRTERIQRGEGARQQFDEITGLARSAREVCGLEAVDHEGGRFGTDDDLEFRAVTAGELRDALRLLEPRIAELLWLVAVEGWTVTEAAGHIGLSRAYANRRLSAAKVLLAEVITAA